MATQDTTRTDKKESDTEQPAPAPHTVTLDAYAPNTLPDFEVFQVVVAASYDSVERVVESEVDG
jgi:hypothetical protein